MQSWTKGDTLFLLCLLSLLAGFSTALVFQQLPEFRTTGTRAGRLVDVNNTVDRKAGTDAFFRMVSNQDTVYFSDIVRTAKNSSLQLELDDGSVIVMDELSLLRLEKVSDGQRLVLERGTVSVSRQPGSKSPLTLQTSKGLVDIQSGTVRADSDAVQLLDGQASLLQSGASSPLAPPTVGKQPLLRSPAPGSTILPAAEGVAFSWVAAGQARLQISRSPDFADLEYDDLASGSTAAVELAPGPWYWRIDSDGVLSRNSRFQVKGADTAPLQLETSPPVEIVRHQQAPRIFELPETVALATGSFELAFANCPPGQAWRVDLQGSDGTSLASTSGAGPLATVSVKDLKPGTVQVQVTFVDNTGKALTPGKTNTLQIIGSLPTPVILEPASDQTVDLKFRDIPALLWQATSQASEYRIELVQRIMDGEQTLHSWSTRELALEPIMEKLLQPGLYVFRVRAVKVENGQVLSISPASQRRVTIKKPEFLPSPRILSGDLTIYVD